MAATPPQRVSANDLYASTSFQQSAYTATMVGDFGYFFYWSYDHGGVMSQVCTVAVYGGSSEEAVIPSKVTYDEREFEVVGIDWRFRDNYGNCRKLTIPNSVIVIEQGAFNDVDRITHLTFEDGDKPLYCHDCGTRHSKYGAFTYMDGLQEVYVGRELAWYYEEYVQAPFYRNNDGSYFKVTIGPKVNTIHYHTFHHAHVNAVEILDAEAELRVEEDAFSDCPNIAKWTQMRQINGTDDQYCRESRELKEIKIGGHVTSIRDDEFMNCYNVYSIDLTEASMLQTIGEHAFEDCDDAETVFIPKSVTRIGYEAFYDMDDLKKITFEDNLEGTPIDMTGGFVFYGYDGYSKSLEEIYLGRTLLTKPGNENYEFADRNDIQKVTVGPGCTAIPDKLFMNCYQMRIADMTKATALKTIGKHAFEDCDKVTTLFIPQSVTKIGYEAFYDIDNLVSLTFEDGEERLDLREGAQFRSYDNANGKLRSVYLGRSVQYDGGYQLDNFNNRRITSVTIGKHVKVIPNDFFYNNPFATITFNPGNGPISIGDRAFVGDGNTTVSSIIIPTPVLYIGEDAFYDNVSLVTLSLKTTSNSQIRKDAFDNCDLLSNIIIDIKGNMIGSQGTDCFEDEVYENATLRYNNVCANYVANNQPWKSFVHKDDTYINKVSFDYNNQTYSLTEGEDGVFRYQDGQGNLQLFPLKDAVAINAPVDFVANVSYDRSITTDKWAETICLPFDMPKPEGWTLYSLPIAQTGTLGKVTLTKVETENIEAFHPYIVKIEDNYTFNTEERTIKALKVGQRDWTITSGDYQLVSSIHGKEGVNYVTTTTAMNFKRTTTPVGPFRAMLKYTGSEDLDALNGAEELWKGSGTQKDPYLISTAEEWGNIHFMMMEMEEDKAFEGVYFRQTADINVTKSIGFTGTSSKKSFAGNYNGADHTLTCNISGSGEAVAPFYKVNCATIENLHVAGTISGGIHSAGLVAFDDGIFTDNSNEPYTAIRNCRVSADITCTGNGTNDAHGGGFIGHKNDSYIYMSNCLFDGSLTAMANGIGDIRLGAFIGWGNPVKIRMYDCVEHGTYNGASAEQIGFSWALSGSMVTNNLPEGCVGNNSGVSTTYELPYCRGVNKYYLLYSITEGMTVTPEEAVNSTYQLGGYAKTENNNYLFGDKLYSQNSKTMKFSIGYDTTWNMRDIQVNENPATRTNKKDVYTYVAVGAAPFKVSGTYAPRWEGTGTDVDPWLIKSEEDFYCMKLYRETPNRYIDMTGKYFTVLPGTYNLAEDVQVDSRLTINGEVTLNIEEGLTLNAIKGINLSKGNSLTIGGSGTLTIDGCDDGKAGIGGYAMGTLVINSGNVNVTGGKNAAGIGGNKNNTDGGSITINGGVVNAKGGELAAGIGGGYNANKKDGYGVCGDIVINGGQVTATSTEDSHGTINAGIGSGQAAPSGSLTLSWTMETDFVNATYMNNDGDENLVETITLAKPFLLDGTTTRATSDNIDGQKIVPNLKDLFIADNQDNSEVINERLGRVCDVTLVGRALFKDGRWNTICLPFDLSVRQSVLKGAEVRTLAETQFDHVKGKLTLNFSDKKSNIAAGVPYIVRWVKPSGYVPYNGTNAETCSDIVEPVFPNVTVTNSSVSVRTQYAHFDGSFSPVSLLADDRNVLYLGSNNKLCYPMDNMTVGSCRAIFQLNGIRVGDLPNQVQAFEMNFDDNTDGISTTNFSNETNEAWYTLDGVRLSGQPTAKGVYVRSTSGDLQGKSNRSKVVIRR